MEETTPAYDLKLERLMDASPAALWRCWSEAELQKQWFCPRPWTTPVIENDMRPGGSSYIVMRGPEGEEHHLYGVFLEVVPERKIVTTDAFKSAWVPAEKPFMTAVTTFEPDGGMTRYTARALHWREEDMKAHEEMGFHEGWGKAADQLEELAKTL